MSYLKDIKQIDFNIEAFNVSSKTLHKTCKYLIKHSTKNLLAPLKECIWEGGSQSSTYRHANGNCAYKVALKIGYSCEIDPWQKEFLNKNKFPFLHEGQRYFVLFFRPWYIIEKKYLTFIKAEQNLRRLIGRPTERNDAIGQFGEFLYCKLFGNYSLGILNQKGFDVINPITNEKIQIKVARKAKTNTAGIAVKLASIEMFDKLAIFWLSDDRKIKDFYELTRHDVMEIVKVKKLKSRKSVDIKLSDIDIRLVKRSRNKFIKAVEDHGLKGLMDSSWEI